jgi:fengycin family lipopeptide synthetase E
LPNDDPLSAVHVGRLPSISSASAAPAIDFNGPVEHSLRPFPAAWLDRSVFSVLCETAAAHADKVALDDGETCLTYRELRERVEALAAYLAAQVGRGAVVGIALPNGTLYPVAMLAVLAAGCTYVPLDLTFPEQRNAYILKHSAMKAIVVDASTREQVARMSAALPQVEIERVTPGSGPAPVSTPEDIALIIYTSGSTGNPKGVYFTQRDLLHHLLQRTNWSHMSANDRVLLLYAPTVSVAQQDIFSPLLAGATLYVVDIRRKGLKEVVEVMRRARITMYHSVPYLFRLLLELCHEDAPFASVRTVFLSSDRIFSSDVELFRRRFPARCCFGLAMGSSETFVYGHWFIPNDEPLEDALVPVGYALPDYQISVVDDAGAPVPRGELGELVIAGRYISLGYWNDAEQSRRAFSTSADDPAIRVYRTGDLGRMRADGLLELIGRIDRQIKIRGHRVEPAEVEATIRTNPVVGDVSVIAFGEGAAVELVAYIAAAPGATLSQAALSEWMTAHLSDAMRPRKLRFVPEIPMLGNFKHDIPRLRAMERERALAANVEGTKAPALPAAPAAPAAAKRSKRAEPPGVREAVRAAWTRVVGAKSFDADMTWAQAGGDSLQALNFVFALEAALHRPMPESTLSPALRPSDIIAKLQNGALDRHAPGTAGPPLFIFPGAIRNVISAANLTDELRAAGYDAQLLSYPPIDADHVGFVDFRSHLDYVLTQIRAVLADDAPVRVLGWSFGGFIAFEVACLLAAEGRKIEFVGVVDIGPYAVARDQAWFATESPLRRLARAVGKGRFVRLLNPHYLSSRLIEEQLRRRMFGLLHWEWRLVDAIGWPRARRKFAVNVTRFIRMRATRGLQISHFAGPVHLFRCRERTFLDAFGHNENPEADIDTPRDMSWGPYCTGVSIAEVPGNHNTPFEPKNLPESLRVILAALRGENEDAERTPATSAVTQAFRETLGSSAAKTARQLAG